MSQGTTVIADGSGAVVLNELNAAFLALLTNNSGAAAPATPSAFQFWADTGNGVLKMRDAGNTFWVVVGPLAGIVQQLRGISATPGGSALTVALGACSVDFRSATLASGAVSSVPVPAAISLVVPSGATLGTTSGVAARLVVLAINNAGTVELAVVNVSGGASLDETTLISTTVLNASALTAGVIYSTIARASVAFRVMGYFDITQATAGAWVSAPTVSQGQGGQVTVGAVSVANATQIGMQQNLYESAAAAGSSDILTAAFTPAITSTTLASGNVQLWVRATLANTTATPTFTPNSGVVTAYTIVKGNNLPLVAGDIAGAGHWMVLTWDSTLTKWVLLNPATGVGPVVTSSAIPRYSNWKAAAIGVNNNSVVISADLADLTTSTGKIYTAVAVLKTINSAGTVGAPLSIMSAKVASTFYYIWLWYNTTNGLTATLDISRTAPTAPTGYVSTDYRARMPGAVLTDASGSKYLMQTRTASNLTMYSLLTGSNTASWPVLISGTQGSRSTPTFVQALWTGYAPSAAVASILVIGHVGPSEGMSAGPCTSMGPEASTNSDHPPITTYGGTTHFAVLAEWIPETNYVYFAGISSTDYLGLRGWRDNI